MVCGWQPSNVANAADNHYTIPARGFAGHNALVRGGLTVCHKDRALTEGNPPQANGTGGYVSATWADWTVLPAINVVNDARYTGDLTLARRYLDPLVRYHLYLDKIVSASVDTSGSNATAEEVPVGLVQDPHLTCLIDTSGGSDDGFVASPVNAVVQAWVYYGVTQVAELARWVGNHTVATHLDATARAMRTAFNRRMVRGASPRHADGAVSIKVA